MLASEIYPENSVPYATTLLNAASMYRAAGRLDLSRELYMKVERIYAVTLDENDMLIIDSSHIIRPQGDVVTEYLEILPTLAPGVLVHIHDIFTPRDYPESWVKKDVRLWNEQYLLEAFMSFNSGFEVVAALNYLMHHYYEQFAAKCPVLRHQQGREPGAFWIRRL